MMLTKKQAEIVGAYTGFAAGPFSDIHEYAEKIMGRPVWTHEFGSEAFLDKLREASRNDFLEICHERTS